MRHELNAFDHTHSTCMYQLYCTKAHANMTGGRCVVFWLPYSSLYQANPWLGFTLHCPKLEGSNPFLFPVFAGLTRHCSFNKAGIEAGIVHPCPSNHVSDIKDPLVGKFVKVQNNTFVRRLMHCKEICLTGISNIIYG